MAYKTTRNSSGRAGEYATFHRVRSPLAPNEFLEGPGEFTTAFFQVYLLHSWRFGANEVERPNLGKLADSCLTSALLHAASNSGFSGFADSWLQSRAETRDSAAYFPQHGKKTPEQPGDSVFTPYVCVAYREGCCQALSRQFKGILSDVALHAAKKQQNLLG